MTLLVMYPKILAIIILLFLFSILLPFARILRLSLPLTYLLVASVSTLFTEWTGEHEPLVLLGLYLLLLLSVLRWVLTFVRFLLDRRDERRSEEALADYMLWQMQNAPASQADGFLFDEHGNLIDNVTKERIYQ